MMAANLRSANAATANMTAAISTATTASAATAATAATAVTAAFLAKDSLAQDTSVPSPTTLLRPSTAPHPLPSLLPPPQIQTMDDTTTPTRASFGNKQVQRTQGMAQQKPLPDSTFLDPANISHALDETHSAADKDMKRLRRENWQPSKQSKDSSEMDVDDSENEDGGEDDGAASDGDGSLNGDGLRSSKKKKGNQRFYCKDYPPCHLSFTRSEHLARHIRKHTGERPFQCHCQRRFSRLDNLRQHAQTVHVNEDIPFDSLAATGTRFQRQVRTDRVQRGGRARPSTAGSVGAPPRGHSKSLSTSSLASMSSLGSNHSPRDDPRRRPPPLVMADPNVRSSGESYRSLGSAHLCHLPYRGASPSEYSTPTSTTFSTGQSSPRWGCGLGSPATSYSRAQGMYLSGSGSCTPGRRLSVPSGGPSGGNPFQAPQSAANLRRPPLAAGALNTSHSAGLASPTASYNMAASPAAEEAWRRRTWHPDSSNLSAPNSRLSQVITSSQLGSNPLPALNQPHPTQQQNKSVRLPGIDSLLPKPGPPPPRVPLSMMIDSGAKCGPLLAPSACTSSEDSRARQHWDMGLHRGLTRLTINNPSNTTPPPRDGAGMWVNPVQLPKQPCVEQAATAPPPQPRQYVRFEEPEPPQRASLHYHTMSAPPVREKRHCWYLNGPVTVHEDRVLEHSRPLHVDRIAHPNLHSFGFPARERRDEAEAQVAASEATALEALLAGAGRESSARAATAC